MSNGENAIFTYLKNIFLRCDTASKKTNPTRPSRKEAWLIAAGENGISGQDRTGCISHNKSTNISHSISCTREGALLDSLGDIDINVERSSEAKSMDHPSLNMFSATLKNVMEDTKIQLLIEVKNMIEENRKETESMIEENRRATNNLIEGNRKELYIMIEDNQEKLDKK